MDYERLTLAFWGSLKLTELPFLSPICGQDDLAAQM